MFAWMMWTALASAAEPMSLDAAWEAAADSPLSALAGVEAERGTAERISARAWGNPSVNYQGFGRTVGTADAINGQQHQLTVSLPLPLTGALPARTKRGRLAESLGEARSEAERAVLAREVADAWFALLAAQEATTVLDDAQRRIDDLVVTARARGEQGALRPWDVERIALEAQALDRELALARQQQRRAAAAVAALTGAVPEDLQAQGDLTAPFVGALQQDAPADVAAQELAVAYASQSTREARWSRLAEPELELGNYWTRDGDSQSLYAGLSWELPLFDRGRGPVAQAVAEERASRAEQAQRQAQRAAQSEAARRIASELGAEVARLGPAQDTLLDGAEVAWREGEASLIELLDAIAAVVDQQLDRIELLGALREAEVQRAWLDGELDSAISPR